MSELKPMTLRYGHSFYNGKELNQFGEVYCDYIRKNFPGTSHLLCSSSSGMAIASAISMYANRIGIEYKILYIKNPEFTFRNRSCPVTGDEYGIKSMVIVDDLIDSGATISHLIDIAKSWVSLIDRPINGIVVWKTIDCIMDDIKGIPVHTLQRRIMI